MDISKFTDKSTGRLESISGVPGVTHAFVPDSLPPEWCWPERLWPLLVEARTALGNLDGTAKHLPNHQLLIRPLQNREAQKSSRLEGTITEPEKQLIFEIDPKYPSSESDPINAYREVFNYGVALRSRYYSHEKLPLSLRLIRELHRILMDGVRGAEKDPGSFRRLQNQIGRPAHFVPPPPDCLAECLDSFEKYLHEGNKYDLLVNAFLVHYQFEVIHPFRDGNGRVGRLLLAIMISEWCGLSNQWLYMSAYFDNNKDAYMENLFNVSAKGDWETWIEFCLIGVIHQAKDTEKRCDALLGLWNRFKDQVKEIGGSYRLGAIVDELFVSPVIRIPHVTKKYDVSFPTAKADLEKLVEVNILSPAKRTVQITYMCLDIINITYKDN